MADTTKVYTLIEKHNPKVQNKKYLAEVIVKHAKLNNVRPRILTAILMQESGFKVNAVSKENKDFGIGQIYHTTLKSYGFNKQKLLTDIDYSVAAAAIVLGDMKKMKHKVDGDDYFVRYNCGFKRAITDSVCQRYKQLVSRYTQ